jgi:hypothetical protein
MAEARDKLLAEIDEVLQDPYIPVDVRTTNRLQSLLKRAAYELREPRRHAFWDAADSLDQLVPILRKKGWQETPELLSMCAEVLRRATQPRGAP